MKTADAVAAIARRLREAGIEEPRREARLLLAAALGTDAAGVFAHENIVEQDYEHLVRRRALREPMAYILGRREFWGLEFAVSRATLIPRPDSETIIEAALAACPERNAVRQILDLGTGTGCLLLAALYEFPAAYGVGVDSSPAAAALARRNAQTLGLAGRAGFLAGDWAAALDAKFDLILCNPPYIPAGDLAGLMPEVAQFEPRAALDGGADGLAAYRRVVEALPALLAQRGVAILELGVGQANSVAALAEQQGFCTATRADLAEIPRALVISFGGTACPK